MKLNFDHTMLRARFSLLSHCYIVSLLKRDKTIEQQNNNETMKQWNNERGFTLIELLVVIVIIGLLSAFLMSNFISVRQRARDAQRKSDLRQIQSALEIYRSDQGSYPTVTGNAVGACASAIVSGASTYMSKLPCDPLPGQTYNTGKYYYTTAGSPPSSYTLGTCLENGNDSDSATTGTDPSGGTVGACSSTKYYVTVSP